MHGKDQKNVFIVGNSMIKNITGKGTSRKNTTLEEEIFMNRNFREFREF